MSENEVIRVSDVMKSRFDMIDGKVTVADALKRMKHVETKTLIVDKRHNDDEYGIVLLSDIAKHVLAVDRSPDRVNVYEIMTKPVITVRPDMDIRYCARLFDRIGLSRAPVLDQGEVVGIVSFTDMILRGFSRLDKNK